MSSIENQFIKTNVHYRTEQIIKIEKVSDIEVDCEIEFEQKPSKIEEAARTPKYQNYTAKCGEIFASNSGKFYYSCCLCDLTLKKPENFKEHVLREHLNLEEEDDRDFEDSLDFPISYEGENNESDDYLGNSYKIMDEDYKPPSNITEDQSSTGNPLDDTLDRINENKNSKHRQDNSTALENTPVPAETEEIAGSNFYCDICNKRYKTERGVANHRVRHEIIATSNDVSLSECHDSEDDEFILEKTVINKSLKCLHCGKQFKNQAQRVCHERTHTGEKPFKCQVCGNSFRLKSQLTGHMRNHTGERPYPCPQCPAKFANRTNRDVHVRAHLGIKRFSCDVCNKSFVRNVEKSMHMRTHTGEKPYQCEVCGTSFNASSKLREHMKRHTNTKPFQCEICFNYYYSKKLLKNHQATHSTEKPFKCNECDARFPRKRALQCHMKIHLDVKEYVCKICGKAFSQNAGLYGHMKSHGHKPGITYNLITGI